MTCTARARAPRSSSWPRSRGSPRRWPTSPGGWSALGCTVVLPVLFGDPGPGARHRRTGCSSIVPACVSKEFAAFAANRTAPVTRLAAGPGRRRPRDVRRAGRRRRGHVLHRRVRPGHDARRPDAGPGAQPAVAAARAARRRRGAACSCRRPTWPGSRSGRPTGCACSACASPATRSSPAARFERLREELGDAFIGVEIDSSKGNPWGIPTTAHSVLTEHLVDEPGQPHPRCAGPGAGLLPRAAAGRPPD